MALVDLDDRETEAPLSRNKFPLLAYIKHFPEVKAQLLTKQKEIEEKRSRRKQVSMPAATVTKPAPTHLSAKIFICYRCLASNKCKKPKNFQTFKKSFAKRKNIIISTKTK